MTDFIAKARANRVIALNLRQNGAMMFFPEEEQNIPNEASQEVRRAVHLTKPMFVRSASLHAAAIVKAPDNADVANTGSEPLVLTEDLAVRKAA